jgi:Holliday junction resolvase
MAARYRKGYRTEKKTVAYLYSLESKPLFVLESRGSHGPFDIVAFYKNYVRLIQVKSGKRPYISSEEVQKMQKAVCGMTKVPYRMEVWIWKDRASEPIIEQVQ